MIEELRTLEEKLVALPVYAEVVNFDTGEQGDKHARVPVELLKSILTALTAASKLEVAKEALQFYAREQSWRSAGMHMCGHAPDCSAVIDRGERARQALGAKP